VRAIAIEEGVTMTLKIYPVAFVLPRLAARDERGAGLVPAPLLPR
jgi:hypothetical protein